MPPVSDDELLFGKVIASFIPAISIVYISCIVVCMLMFSMTIAIAMVFFYTFELGHFQSGKSVIIIIFILHKVDETRSFTEQKAYKSRLTLIKKPENEINENTTVHYKRVQLYFQLQNNCI
jgi:hypothetical protein